MFSSGHSSVNMKQAAAFSDLNLLVSSAGSLRSSEDNLACGLPRSSCHLETVGAVAAASGAAAVSSGRASVRDSDGLRPRSMVSRLSIVRPA
jgi:hypothetical protein